MAPATPLAKVVGDQLRKWREARGLSQNEVAGAARARGFAWKASTVAAIEIGRRDVSLDEFLALPFVAASFSGGTPPALQTFLGDGRTDVSVKLGADGFIHNEHLVALVSGQTVGNDRGQVPREALSYPEGRRDLRRGWEAYYDAEIKAARQLHVSVLHLAQAARRVWGRTLTQERDARVAERVQPNTDPRTVQARRGHVTRVLIAELRQALKAKVVTTTQKERTR